MSKHSLEDIVHSIQSAVLAATDIAERHELDSLQKEEFWERQLDDKGEPVKDEEGREVYAPKMVTLRLPVWHEQKLIERDVPIPLQSLTTGQSLRVDTLEVEMSVKICGLSGDGKGSNLMVRPTGNVSWFKKRNDIAKLKIVFKGSDPPEGYARIDDQLIKLLP
jgi:hydroxylamine reductase (hybrid-cluster protein)